jgi:hypothetical protein
MAIRAAITTAQNILPCYSDYLVRGKRSGSELLGGGAGRSSSSAIGSPRHRW